MPQTLAELDKGYRFPAASFELTAEWVEAYAAAIEAPGAGVPPMALAALSIRALLEQSPLPPGSIHAGQELSFARAASVGEKLSTQAEVVSRGERQGWVLMSVNHSVSDATGSDIMQGRATITFPIGPEAGS